MIFSVHRTRLTALKEIDLVPAGSLKNKSKLHLLQKIHMDRFYGCLHHITK